MVLLLSGHGKYHLDRYLSKGALYLPYKSASWEHRGPSLEGTLGICLFRIKNVRSHLAAWVMRCRGRSSEDRQSGQAGTGPSSHITA